MAGRPAADNGAFGLFSGDSGACRDRDPAAWLLYERHMHGRGVELERGRDLVSDLDGERLAERSLVAEARQVDLQRLRLEAERLGPVLDRRGVEVGLVRDR